MTKRFATYSEVTPARAALVKRLRRMLSPDRVLSSDLELEAYAYDASMERGRPAAVVFPETAEEIARLYALCEEESLPLIPRGSGTNLSGGSTAPLGGIVCQFSRMNRILAIDADARRTRAEAYVYNDEVNQAVAKHGLHFAPDPSSFRVSTLGGNAAENSGGPHALKYGVTTQHILGLRLVTPAGEVLDLGGAPFERPGADLVSLIVGSEGTLGAITEVTLRLTPLPEYVRTLLAVFDDEHKAGEAVSAVIASGIIPSTLEMLDRETIRAVEASMPAGYPPDADAVLLIEVDGVREAVAEEAAVVERVCTECGARTVESTSDPLERDRLWHGRRSSYAALARAATGLMVCDGVVPRDVIPEALRRIRATVSRHGIRMADTFHAGDGNVHPKLIFEASAPGEVRGAMIASAEIMRICIDLGGAVSGEHGIGTEKIHAVPWSLDAPTLRLTRATKLLFDPTETTNPGKVLEARDVPPAGPAPARADSLQNDLAAAGCEPRAGAPDDAVDGLTPEWVVEPANTEALAVVLGTCAAHHAPVALVGGGQSLNWGPPLSALSVLVSTRRMAAATELRPQNLSATFEAGATLESIRATLRDHRLTVRFDPPRPEAATVGGIAATAASGPSRLGLGPLRDGVLGIRVALTTGETARLGGRVMKNVAGYDFTHLLVGSRGALAAIGEVTLRLAPVPAVVGGAEAECESLESAMELALETFRRIREPQAIRVSLVEGSVRFSAFFAGPGAAVERLLSECAASHSSISTWSAPGGDKNLAAHSGLGSGLPVRETPAVEIALPPGREADILPTLQSLTPSALMADVGAGYVSAAFDGLTDDDLRSLHRAATDLGGWVLDVRGPAALRRGFFDWKGRLPVLDGLKTVFDAAGVLAPGRLS